MTGKVKFMLAVMGVAWVVLVAYAAWDASTRLPPETEAPAWVYFAAGGVLGLGLAGIILATQRVLPGLGGRARGETEVIHRVEPRHRKPFREDVGGAA